MLDTDPAATPSPAELMRLRQRVAALEAALAATSNPGPTDDERHQTTRTRILVQLARSQTLGEGNLRAAVREIVEGAAGGLEVERASVWLYAPAHAAIRCVDLYERTPHQHSAGAELAAVDYPAYFRALDEERTLAAHDARGDPRTSEFTATYLIPLGITSMLDAPIRVHGRMVGVVCHEHVGSVRHWTRTEQHFAGSVADLVALAIEGAELRQTQEALQRAHDELEQRVTARTAELAAANRALQAEIADRERTEAALRTSEARNQALLDAWPDLVFRLSRDGTYLDCRVADPEQLWGPPEAIIGTTLGTVPLPAEVVEQLRRAIEDALDTGQIQTIEYSRVTPAGPRDYEARLVASGPDEVVAIVRDTTERQHALEERARLRAAVDRLEERGRIAMDLHDGAIQSLYAVLLKLSTSELTGADDPAALQEAVAHAQVQLHRVIRDIRDYIFELRPPGSGSLVAGLEALHEELRVSGLVRPELHLAADAEAGLSIETTGHLLQFSREAVSNALRHARAITVRILVERTDGTFRLTVADDGRGFDPHAAEAGRGQGLRNMAQRASLVGGRLAIRAMPGQGTEVRLTLPIDP